jgi:hypothetical protein
MVWGMPPAAQHPAAGLVAVALVADQVLRALARPTSPTRPRHPNPIQDRLQLGAVMVLALVTTIDSGRPLPSTARCSLVVSLPRERPSAEDKPGVERPLGPGREAPNPETAPLGVHGRGQRAPP